MPLRLAILASGSGTNAQSMIDKMHSGLLDITITLIASNNPKAFVLERAKKAGIPTVALDHRDFENRIEFDLELLKHIQKSQAEAVALAGYMRLISAEFLKNFQGHVLNLHPALLPSFPGLHGARDALAYGVPITGATVHFVDEKMDNGPVIIQAAVPVHAGESEEELLSRIHAFEHRIYPQALQWLAQKRLSIQGRSVFLEKSDLEIPPQPKNALVWPPLESGF